VSVLAHIAGPSGSGKTTLGEQLKQLYPILLVQDLDEMDELAADELFKGKSKKEYTDDNIELLAQRRQQLLDSYVKDNKDKDIVLVGHHTEGNTVLNIHTNNKWMLDTPPLTSAYRAYLRSQNGPPDHRRLLSELPLDYKEAQDIVKQLKHLGYQKYSPDQVIKMIGEMK